MHRAALAFLAALVCTMFTPAASLTLSDDFYSTIRNNDLGRLNSLISGGADANTRDHHEETPLM